jgi:hypothetical protein
MSVKWEYSEEPPRLKSVEASGVMLQNLPATVNIKTARNVIRITGLSVQ